MIDNKLHYLDDIAFNRT